MSSRSARRPLGSLSSRSSRRSATHHCACAMIYFLLCKTEYYNYIRSRDSYIDYNMFMGMSLFTCPSSQKSILPEKNTIADAKCSAAEKESAAAARLNNIVVSRRFFSVNK